MKATGGNWDPKEPPIYFLAADMGSVGLAATRHGHVLVALSKQPPTKVGGFVHTG